MIDDGRLSLEVLGVDGGTDIQALVVEGGIVSDNKGISMVVFDTEDQANAAKAMIEQGPPNPDAVTLESVEVREVIESA